MVVKLVSKGTADRPLVTPRAAIVVLVIDAVGFAASLALLQPILPYLYREIEERHTAIEAFIAISFVAGGIPAVGALLIALAYAAVKRRAAAGP